MSSDPGHTSEDTSDDARSDPESGDDGHVHRPEGQPKPASTAAVNKQGLGRAGWVLVGAVVVSVLVIPGLIYLYPAAPGDAGLSFLVALLVLPFLPAVVLGIVAVWSMTAGDD